MNLIQAKNQKIGLWIISLTMAIVAFIMLPNQVLKILVQQKSDALFHDATFYSFFADGSFAVKILFLAFLPLLMQRFGILTVFNSIVALSVGALFLCGMSIASEWIFLSAFVFIVSMTTLGSVQVTLMQRLVAPAYRARLQGLLTMLISVAYLFPPFLEDADGSTSWIYFMMAIALGALMLPLLFLKDPSDSKESDHAASKEAQHSLAAVKGLPAFFKSFSHVFTNPLVFLLVTISGINNLFFVFLVFIGKDAHLSGLHLDDFQSIVSGLASLILVFPITWCADHFGAMKVCVLSIVALILIFVALILLPETFFGVTFLYFVMAGIATSQFTLSLAYIGHSFSKDELGSIFASKSIWIAVLSMGVSYVFGLLLTTGTLIGLNLLLASLNMIALVALVYYEKRFHAGKPGWI